MTDYLNRTRAVRALRFTPHILQFTIRNLTQEQAEEIKDGAEGWNIPAIVCHLRDLEQVYTTRAKMMVEDDMPLLPSYDHEAATEENDYMHADYEAALAEYIQLRHEFIQWLESLPEESLHRLGQHPEYGPLSVLDQAANMSWHDVNHIEQITKAFVWAGR